jgi:hypothetical protein
MGSKRRKSIHGKGSSIANTTPLSVDRFSRAFNPILEPILELFLVSFKTLHELRDCPRTSISSSFWMILADFRSNFWGQYTSGRYCPQKLDRKSAQKHRKIDRNEVCGQSLKSSTWIPLNPHKKLIFVSCSK